MSILTILLGEVCSSTNRLISSSKDLSYFYYKLSCQVSSKSVKNFLRNQRDRQTDTQTHRQIHADGNNASPKTKFLGEVNIRELERVVFR